VTARCRKHKSVTSLQYNWNGEGFNSKDSYSVGSSFSNALTLYFKANDGTNDYTITLEPVNFIWQGAEIN